PSRSREPWPYLDWKVLGSSGGKIEFQSRITSSEKEFAGSPALGFCCEQPVRKAAPMPTMGKRTWIMRAPPIDRLDLTFVAQSHFSGFSFAYFLVVKMV
ncbi:MAG TPA: hypothetical protein VFW62_01775, partial [bacterium]|nr:hypothetical protein [bacterium]